MAKRNSPPTQQQLLDLWDVVANFIDDMQIHCPETIHQTDRVIENAYAFIEQVCEVAGYAEIDEDE